jgi:hypothetical protein
MKRLQITLWAFFGLAIIAQAALWMNVREVQSRWLNVPPVPSDTAINASALSDDQFAYRSVSIMLQNLGDTGGRTTSLKDYNYDKLAQWFYLARRLDDKSSYVPYIAAYYFGALEGYPEKLRPLVKYLYEVGNDNKNEKWRWLAHGVYLARFRMEDLDTAYGMALDLAALADRPDSDMPNWARQMPAFILNAKGDKEAALAIMLEIISSVGEKLHPNEINHTRGYICEQIFTPEEAEKNELCQGDF